MKHRTLGWLCAATVTALAACLVHSKRETFSSNVASVRAEGDTLVAIADGKPFSGTLVARDGEIAEVARTALVEPLAGTAAHIDPRGLILVLPMERGRASGRASLRLDLREKKLGRDLSNWRAQLEVALASELGATVEVASATFEAGKLEGRAVIASPTRGGETPMAEAQFRDNRLDGVAREYYSETGTPKRELHFDRGVRSGRERVYYQRGAVEIEHQYLAGELHGESIEYYASGAMRARYRHHRGRPVGRHEAWYPDGTMQRLVEFDDAGTRLQEWYSNGQLKLSVGPDGEVQHPPDGVVVEYYPSGAIRSRTSFRAGVQHGDFVVFYSSGRKWEIGRFDEGRQTGIHRKWWKNGHLALDSKWREGALHGSYRRWYANGTLWEEASYDSGKRTGRYRRWWKNGAIAHDYHYVEGKLNGDVRTFYDNGAKWAIGRYEHGKPQGIHRRWFPDGRLGFIQHHVDGRPDGPLKRWYANGTLRLDASYSKGRLNGELKNWLEDGTVYEIATYERGRKLRSTRPPKDASSSGP